MTDKLGAAVVVMNFTICTPLTNMPWSYIFLFEYLKTGTEVVNPLAWPRLSSVVP